MILFQIELCLVVRKGNISDDLLERHNPKKRENFSFFEILIVRLQKVQKAFELSTTQQNYSVHDSQ